MINQDLLGIFKTTANRIFKRQYRYFVLDKTRISEFEARQVMTKVLEESKCPYGIELQTKEKHLAHVGLVDLVVFDRDKPGVRLGWVEFKRGKAPEVKIRKDFEKMMKEPGLEFVSFFHIIPVPGRGVKKHSWDIAEVVLRRYGDAHQLAYNKAIQAKKAPVPKAFMLFLLDCENGRYLVKRVANVLSELDFQSKKWSKVGYGVQDPAICWIPGKVDRDKEHIKLFYGDAKEKGWDEFEEIALLSPPTAKKFRVEFIVDEKDAKQEDVLEAVKDSLDYYLIELEEKDPWAYARYHCGTAANMYPMVHWAYYRTGDSSSPVRSEITKSGGTKWLFKPEPDSK